MYCINPWHSVHKALPWWSRQWTWTMAATVFHSRARRRLVKPSPGAGARVIAGAFMALSFNRPQSLRVRSNAHTLVRPAEERIDGGQGFGGSEPRRLWAV